MLWITGAKGLLGSALSSECGEKLYIGTGREVDISDLETVRSFIDQNRVTHIVNCAAFSQVDAAEEHRESAFRDNVLGPQNLAFAAKEAGAQLLHISTDYVFSGDLKRPLTELDPVGPCNFYGKTKLEGEQRALDLSACVIRTSAIFGSGGKNFVSKLFQMFQTQKEICLTHDQYNRMTYAPDLAAAILQMLNYKGLYHYANEGVTSKYEFALAMRDEALLLGFPVVTESIVPVSGAVFSSPCKRPVYSALDTTKIERFITLRHWRSALRDFLCAQRLACL